jgi:hypothetical protein
VHALHMHDIWNFSVKTTSNYAIYQVNYELIREISINLQSKTWLCDSTKLPYNLVNVAKLDRIT